MGIAGSPCCQRPQRPRPRHHNFGLEFPNGFVGRRYSIISDRGSPDADGKANRFGHVCAHSRARSRTAIPETSPRPLPSLPGRRHADQRYGRDGLPVLHCVAASLSHRRRPALIEGSRFLQPALDELLSRVSSRFQHFTIGIYRRNCRTKAGRRAIRPKRLRNTRATSPRV